MNASTVIIHYIWLSLIHIFFAAWRENFKCALLVWLPMLAVLVLCGFDLYFAVPVSYTHLDVYKRQPRHCSRSKMVVSTPARPRK